MGGVCENLTPGLTLKLPEGIHQAEDNKCYFGIGRSNFVSLHKWSNDN